MMGSIIKFNIEIVMANFLSFKKYEDVYYFYIAIFADYILIFHDK